MAKYIYAGFTGYDCDGNLQNVQIYGPSDVDYVELTPVAPMATIVHQRDESKWLQDPIMYAELNLQFLNNSTEANDFVTLLANAQEGEYIVRIVTNPESTNVMQFTGIIMPDTITVGLGCNQVVNIRAFDGLRLLANYNTHVTSDVFGTNFYRMLNKLPNYAEWYPNTAQSVLWDPQFTVTGAANQVFKDVKFERQFDNDLEYLKAVLNDLNMMLVHTNGYYYLINLLAWSSGSISGTWYKEQSLTAISSATLNYTSYASTIDEGALKRFTRPYNEVRLTYQPSDIKRTVEVAESTTGSSTTLSVLNATGDDTPPFNNIKIEGYARLTASSGAPDDTRTIRIQIKYGSKYLTDTNTWSNSSQWIDLGVDFVGVNMDSIAPIYFLFNIAGAGYSTPQTLLIDLEYFSEDNTSTGNLATEFARVTLSLVDAEVKDWQHTTGTTEPFLEGDNFFSANSILGIDGMYSNGLAAYIGDDWAYSVSTGYLHELRADQLALNATAAQTLVDGFIDNLRGPLAFYQVLSMDVLPIYCSRDILRNEGNIVALSV